MGSIRQQQTAETIKRHFSIVLQQEGPNIYGMDVLVSVTNVIMSPDLGIAKIYVSVFNTENKQAIILMLQDQISRLKYFLSQRLKSHMRRCPDIEIFIDETLDEMEKVDRLFDRLYRDNQMGKSNLES